MLTRRELIKDTATLAAVEANAYKNFKHCHWRAE